MGQFLQGGKNGRLMSFFLKYSLRVTKPDEIASFSQFSVVSHMLWMPKTLWLDLWTHLYVDDFPFFNSSLACLEPELELFEVWAV